MNDYQQGVADENARIIAALADAQANFALLATDPNCKAWTRSKAEILSKAIPELAALLQRKGTK